MITASELRKKYIEFFKSKGHKIIPSASLIPENDPTVLFTTAGMHPLVPYLMGQPHLEGDKLVDVQKCVRTGDIEDVGDNRHLTFFEMLGNWSLGDYFKEDAIKWSYEFLTSSEWLGLNPKRLFITVFKGEGNIKRDDKSIKIWQEQFKKHGIEAKIAGDDAVWSDPDVRIFALPKDDNFWEMGGESGPCGPDTEIFYDTKPKRNHEKKTFMELSSNILIKLEDGSLTTEKQPRFMEIWNNVFMAYNKIDVGNYKSLSQKNVDTGMGVERTLVALNGLNNVFETELFAPIVELIEELSDVEKIESAIKNSESTEVEKMRFEMSRRIIADHIKAAVMILADDKKLVPSNVERGYVLRRLIRRAVRHGLILGINGKFTSQVAKNIIGIYKNIYKEVEKNQEFIFEQLDIEEEKFAKTLKSGLKKLEEIIKDFENDSSDHSQFMRSDSSIRLSGQIVFDLYQTYGFPPELTREELAKHALTYHEEEFQEELRKHQELSRTASAGMFKSGLADGSEAATRLHTATHLLQAALRKILGAHVEQRGSNITPERLRFDFSHPEKMTPEQIKQVEDWVNAAIEKKLPVIREEMSPEEAKASGALGLFDSKYGNKVSVYTIKDGNKVVSKEICSGPHIENTGQIGKFKIKKEESSSQGVRRIKAII